GSSAARSARGSLSRPKDVVADRLRVGGAGEAGATFLQLVHGWVPPLAPAGEPGGRQTVGRPVQRGGESTRRGVLLVAEPREALRQEFHCPAVLGVAALPQNVQPRSQQVLR